MWTAYLATIPVEKPIKEGGQNFKWSPECENTFRKLKNMFPSAPIRRHYDSSLPTQLETDARDFAIGVMLGQLHNKQLIYEVHDKEMLAIVSAFTCWHHYLQGPAYQITIYTDHKNLEYFTVTKVLNRRQAGWAQELAGYNFKIVYRKESQTGKWMPYHDSRSTVLRWGGSNDENLQALLKPELDLESVWNRSAALRVEAPSEILCSCNIAAMKVVQFVPELLAKLKKAAETDELYQVQKYVRAGQGISKDAFLELLMPALEKTMQQRTLWSAFKHTGIHPHKLSLILNKLPNIKQQLLESSTPPAKAPTIRQQVQHTTSELFKMDLPAGAQELIESLPDLAEHQASRADTAEAQATIQMHENSKLRTANTQKRRHGEGAGAQLSSHRGLGAAAIAELSKKAMKVKIAEAKVARKAERERAKEKAQSQVNIAPANMSEERRRTTLLMNLGPRSQVGMTGI